MIPEVDTKKELIVELARRDPFLRIDEIAARADTTPRYVRTILSEARVSLMKLRRNYARLMEQKLEHAASLSEVKSDRSVVSTRAQAGSSGEALSVSRIVHPSYAHHLGVPFDTPLLVVSQRQLRGQVRFADQVILPGEFKLSLPKSSETRTLREIVGVADLDGTSQERFLLVEPADIYTADLLDVQEGVPVLRSGAVLTKDGRKVALELTVFSAYAVEVQLESPPQIVPSELYEGC